MDTRLGSVVTADEVCVAVQTLLQTYLPAVFVDAELDPPVRYDQVPSLAALEADASSTPTIGVFTDGTQGDPIRDENGAYAEVWRVTVCFFVRGDDYDDTAHRCRVGTQLIQVLLVQNPTLGGVAAGVYPGEKRFDRAGADAARTLGIGEADILVAVTSSFSDMRSAPYEPTSTVLSVDTDVDPDLHPALQ